MSQRGKAQAAANATIDEPRCFSKEREQLGLPKYVPNCRRDCCVKKKRARDSEDEELEGDKEDAAPRSAIGNSGLEVAAESAAERPAPRYSLVCVPRGQLAALQRCMPLSGCGAAFDPFTKNEAKLLTRKYPLKHQNDSNNIVVAAFRKCEKYEIALQVCTSHHARPWSFARGWQRAIDLQAGTASSASSARQAPSSLASSAPIPDLLAHPSSSPLFLLSLQG